MVSLRWSLRKGTYGESMRTNLCRRSSSQRRLLSAHRHWSRRRSTSFEAIYASKIVRWQVTTPEDIGLSGAKLVAEERGKGKEGKRAFVARSASGSSYLRASTSVTRLTDLELCSEEGNERGGITSGARC